MVFSTVCAEWMGQLTMIHGSFCFNTWLIIARLERTRENKPQARNKRFRYALSLFWSLSEIVSLIHEGCRNVWKKKKVFIIHDTGVLKQAVSGWRCQKHAQCSLQDLQYVKIEEHISWNHHQEYRGLFILTFLWCNPNGWLLLIDQCKDNNPIWDSFAISEVDPILFQTSLELSGESQGIPASKRFNGSESLGFTLFQDVFSSWTLPLLQETYWEQPNILNPKKWFFGDKPVQA